MLQLGSKSIIFVFLITILFSCNYGIKKNKRLQIVDKGEYSIKEIKLKHVDIRIKKKIYDQLNIDSSKMDSVFIEVYAVCHVPISGNSNRTDTVLFKAKTTYCSKDKLFLFGGSNKLLRSVSR